MACSTSSSSEGAASKALASGSSEGAASTALASGCLEGHFPKSAPQYARVDAPLRRPLRVRLARRFQLWSLSELVVWECSSDE